jgi:hypothetical protein
MLDSLVFPRLIPLFALLYSMSNNSLSKVFKVVLGVN